MILEKQCKGCGKVKFVNDFNKAGGAKDGLHHYCIPCHRFRHKALNIAAIEAGYTRRTWIKIVPNKARKPLIDKKFLELLGQKEVNLSEPVILDPILERVRAKYREERRALDNKQITLEEGFIYCISNPQWPNTYKVGSALDYEKRLNTYQTYDPNRSYKLECKEYVSNRTKAETEVHTLLKDWLKSGEWFTANLDTIKNQIKNVSCKYQ